MSTNALTWGFPGCRPNGYRQSGGSLALRIMAFFIGILALTAGLLTHTGSPFVDHYLSLLSTKVRWICVATGATLLLLALFIQHARRTTLSSTSASIQDSSTSSGCLTIKIKEGGYQFEVSSPNSQELKNALHPLENEIKKICKQAKSFNPFQKLGEKLLAKMPDHVPISICVTDGSETFII